MKQMTTNYTHIWRFVKMEVISREEALEKGLKRYFTGKPCKRGHVSERRVNNGNCVVCRRKYDKDWKENNEERWKEYTKEWKEKNKDYIKKYNKGYLREWNKKNKDYIKEWREYNIEYRKEYEKEYQRTRYATDESFKTSVMCRNILNRTLSSTSSTKDTRTHEMLGYCNEQLRENIESKFLCDMSWGNYGDWHIDHVYPVSRYIADGIEDPAIINSLYNLIPMWSEHNLEKSSQTLEEFLDNNPELIYLYGHFLDVNKEYDK